MKIIKNLFSFDALITIVIPIVVVILEQIMKKTLEVYDLNVSITLSSIALGQIFPFIIFETLLSTKIFKIRTETISNKDTLQMTYKFENNKSPKSVENMRKIVYLIFCVCLILFFLNIYFSFKGQTFIQKNIFGFINVILVWGFIIFA